MIETFQEDVCVCVCGVSESMDINYIPDKGQPAKNLVYGSYI